jgi:hypothetical protein
MIKDTSIIRILTYGLPFKLSNQIFNEFQGRYTNIKYLINKYDYYKNFREDLKTIELLLSLSIFHKRVISNLDAAAKFYKTVNLKSGAETIAMGSYKLTLDEKTQLLAIVITYKNLLQKYNIPQYLIDSYDNKDFLRNLKNLLLEIKNAEEKHNPNNENQTTESDEFPF